MKHRVFSILCSASLTVTAQQARPVDAIINEFYHHPGHIMVAPHTKYPENSLEQGSGSTH